MSLDSMLSRTANPDRQFVEVRPLIPVEIVAVIDAWGMSRGLNRTEALNEWVRDRAAKEHRSASLIVNASRGNAPIKDGIPVAADSGFGGL